MNPPTDDHLEVLVVGGGAAGAAAAKVLAEAGRTVTLVERSAAPGPTSLGGLLTPRAVAELSRLDLTPPPGRTISSIVLVSHDHEIERPWPEVAGLPDHGLVVDRTSLGAALLDRARRAGANVLTGCSATDPIVERGFVRGAVVTDDHGRTSAIRSRYVIAADGSTSRFGRSIGTFRRKDWPFVTALGGRWSSVLAGRSMAGTTEPGSRIELHLGLSGHDASFVAGTGWVLPSTECDVRIGIGLWSTSREFGVLNASEVLGSLAERVADRWGIDPEVPLGPHDGARIPVGGSVVPVAGPAHLVAGDAAGVANPLSVAGIEAALWSGRLAGEVLVEALESRDPTALQRYPSMIASTTGGYYKVGRLATRLASHPSTSGLLARAASSNRHLADTALRIGLQHLRRQGGPETVYRIARTASRFGPAS